DPHSRPRIQNLPRRKDQTPSRRLHPLPLQRRIHRTRVPQRTPTTPKQPPPQTTPNSTSPQPSSRRNKPGPDEPPSILRRPHTTSRRKHSSPRLNPPSNAQKSQPRTTSRKNHRLPLPPRVRSILPDHRERSTGRSTKEPTRRLKIGRASCRERE